MEEIELKAIVTKIQTTTDGGWRVHLDIDQSETAPVMRLSTFRDFVVTLKISTEENESGAV